MRLFLAIELSDPFRKHLLKLQNALRPLAPRIAWTRPDNLHLTLKFLGQVPDHHVKPLADSLSHLSTSTPIDLHATHLVGFPPAGPVRIVAAALAAPPSLLQLVSRIESACHSLGFPREPRAYTPHITLARAREPLPTPLRKTLENAARPMFPGPTFAPTEFTLMLSNLLQHGPVYTPAARFSL